jgi:two-component system response regulator AtoC
MRGISDHNMKRFLDYDWPGNVRELENMVKRIVILGNEDAAVRNYFKEKENNLNVSSSKMEENLPEPVVSSVVSLDSSSFSLKKTGKTAARKAESELIKKVLQDTHWNRKETAKILGISYKALLYKIKECDWEEKN